MSVFNQIINGGGNSELKWVATLLIGDDKEQELYRRDTYAEILPLKLNHKKSNNIVLELHCINFLTGRKEMLIGHDENMLELSDIVKKIF